MQVTVTLTHETLLTAPDQQWFQTLESLAVRPLQSCDIFAIEKIWIRPKCIGILLEIGFDGGDPLRRIGRSSVAMHRERHDCKLFGQRGRDLSPVSHVVQCLIFVESLHFDGPFDGIAAQVVGMQDIMLDGTNTPGVPCNAISIGVKFTAKQIANDATTVDPAPLPNPCAFDAGTD